MMRPSFSSHLRFGSVAACALLFASLLLDVPLPQGRVSITSFASATPYPSHFSLARRVVKGAALYGLYSVAVDRCATKKYAAMESIPPAVLPLYQGRRRVASRWAESAPLLDEDAPVVTAAELRKTISRWSWLVEDPQDRCRWNQWARTPPPSGSSSKPPNGTYLFTYRSYMNHLEERNAIANSFYPIQRWFAVHVFRRPSVMTISDNGAQISMTDSFLVRHPFWRLACVPVTVTWRGSLRPSNGNRHYKIVWTETEVNLPSGTIQSPPESERMRQDPWYIVNVEDGMLLFQRGDLGILAFDLVANR